MPLSTFPFYGLVINYTFLDVDESTIRKKINKWDAELSKEDFASALSSLKLSIDIDGKLVSSLEM